MIVYSYRITQGSNSNPHKITDSQWEQSLRLRDELNEQEEKNRELQNELNTKHEMVREFEAELANEAQVYFNLAEDAEKYRMFLGKVKVKGSGVKVTLSDGEYDPNEPNINNYLVHEHHVFKVVNELYISGATAVTINGQRLKSDSYIVCDGPVITVDGVPHPAPFVITAIGDPDVLAAAINLTGGVKDQLVNDNVVFSIEKENEIVLDPILGS